MDDLLAQRQQLEQSVNLLVATIRDFLAAPSPGTIDSLLEDVAIAERELAAAETDSLLVLIKCLERLLRKYRQQGTLPSPLEGELFELAADWLVQIAALYREGLPEPRRLISDLQYTFDLVERSQGAPSLAELLGEAQVVGGAEQVDPFVEDPDFDPAASAANDSTDPFAEDPGFSMEFDLLQRALSRSPQKAPTDPFASDPAFFSEDEASS
jgi:hypothetical protein